MVESSSGKGSATSDRRGFFKNLSRLFMFGGLFAGYGIFGAMAGRFLFPPSKREDRWTFLADVNRLAPGESFIYRTPAGSPVNVARLGGTGKVEDFVALSSTCPHLGCQVFWEAQNDRFFCPCHNGTFSREGKPTGGPPKEANQPLKRYPLKMEGGILYVELPYELESNQVARRDVGSPPGPGHDPCLYVSSRGEEA